MNKALISLLVACVLLAPAAFAASAAEEPLAVAKFEKLVLSEKLEAGKSEYLFNEPITVSIISGKVPYAQVDNPALRPTPPIVSFKVKSIEFTRALTAAEVTGYEIDVSGLGPVVFNPTTNLLPYKVSDCQAALHDEVLTSKERFACARYEYPLPENEASLEAIGYGAVDTIWISFLKDEERRGDVTVQKVGLAYEFFFNAESGKVRLFLPTAITVWGESVEEPDPYGKAVGGVKKLGESKRIAVLASKLSLPGDDALWDARRNAYTGSDYGFTINVAELGVSAPRAFAEIVRLAGSGSVEEPIKSVETTVESWELAQKVCPETGCFAVAYEKSPAADKEGFIQRVAIKLEGDPFDGASYYTLNAPEELLNEIGSLTESETYNALKRMRLPRYSTKLVPLDGGFDYICPPYRNTKLLYEGKAAPRDCAAPKTKQSTVTVFETPIETGLPPGEYSLEAQFEDSWGQVTSWAEEIRWSGNEIVRQDAVVRGKAVVLPRGEVAIVDTSDTGMVFNYRPTDRDWVRTYDYTNPFEAEQVACFEDLRVCITYTSDEEQNVLTSRTYKTTKEFVSDQELVKRNLDDCGELGLGLAGEEEGPTGIAGKVVDANVNNVEVPVDMEGFTELVKMLQALDLAVQEDPEKLRKARVAGLKRYSFESKLTRKYVSCNVEQAIPGCDKDLPAGFESGEGKATKITGKIAGITYNKIHLNVQKNYAKRLPYVTRFIKAVDFTLVGNQPSGADSKVSLEAEGSTIKGYAKFYQTSEPLHISFLAQYEICQKGQCKLCDKKAKINLKPFNIEITGTK